MLKPYTPNQTVTVTTEATEAFDKWSAEPANRIYFFSFLNKLEDDPHSPISASLLGPTFELMETYGFDPTHFELSNLVSALSASNNWKRFANSRDNEYRLAAVLITELTRLTGSKEEYTKTVWEIAQEWSNTPPSPPPEQPVQALCETLFDTGWTMLYADALNSSYLDNLQVIKTATPHLQFKPTPSSSNILPPDDISP